MNTELLITDQEREQGSLSIENLRQAVQLFRERGTLLLRGVFPPELIETLKAAYIERYATLPEYTLKETSLEVGNKRFMVTVDIAPPFSDPGIYASPLLLPLLDALLAGLTVLDSFGSVCSFPGSARQHIHMDHNRLFESEQLCAALPPYAITVVIPLRDITMECGTTALWEGSHRMVGALDMVHKLRASEDLPGAAYPLPRMGDVYFMDYRLVHGGTANLSSEPRPIMYLVYSRSWFRDAGNFSGQPAIQISKEVLAGVPAGLQRLFKFAIPYE